MSRPTCRDARKSARKFWAAAGTGKAFNEARFDGIGPAAHRNDRNRLGRILGRPDPRVPSCHDDINCETHQIGRKSKSEGVGERRGHKSEESEGVRVS